VPKLCRPYRAKTKGKVERFNHYLRHSFYHPLASRLKPLDRRLDKATANVEGRHWLGEVANRRLPATASAKRLRSILAGGLGMNLQHERLQAACAQRALTTVAEPYSTLAQQAAPET